MLKILSIPYLFGSTYVNNAHMPCIKHLINMTSTTSIVENLDATDYLNDVVFFYIFFVEVVIQLREKKLWKNTSIRAHVKEGRGFINIADCSIVGLQESCYPQGARGLLTDIFFKINKKLKELDSVLHIVIIAANEAMRQNKNKNASKYPKCTYR